MLGICGWCIYDSIEYNKHPNYWLVKVTFCDSRPPVHITTESRTTPSTRDVVNSGPYKRGHALTEYHGFLNVCEVKTIKQIKP